jgi:CBS domain-containing protein
MTHLKAKDVMTANPTIVVPAQTVKNAAVLMKDIDCGVLPVGTLDHVIGMITDRDLVLRVIAEGRDPAHTVVRDVMTKEHYSCNEDDDLEAVAKQMRKHNVRRLVVTKKGAISGIISVECLLRKSSNLKAKEHLLHVLLGDEAGATKQHAA